VKLFMYIRLSSADDDLKYKTESESIANQRMLLQQYIRTHSELALYEQEEFVDDGYSGTNDQRPSFERMIERLKNGEAKLVICKDFSRFFRDYVEIGDYLERIFPFLGVRFISVNDGYDSDDYKGTTAGMDVVMKYIVYSYYSRDLSQKIKTVMSSRAKKGEFLGSYAPYGYMKDPDRKNHLIPDPETAPIVKRIFDLWLAGNTVSEVARVLNADHIETPSSYFHRKFPDCGRFKNKSKENSWDNGNIRMILERRIYTGAMVSNTRDWKGIANPQTRLKPKSEWLVIKNCHEAIISEEDFERADSRFKRLPKYEQTKLDYPLRTLMRCGSCGRVFQRNNRVKRIYYHCAASNFKDDTACPVNERYYEDELERVVIQNLRDMLMLLTDCNRKLKEAAARTIGSADNLKQTVLRTEKSIKKMQAERMDLYEQYSDGKISRDEYLLKRERLSEEIAEQEVEKQQALSQLSALEAQKNPEMDVMASEAERFLKAESVNNQMLLFFIDRVYVYSGMRLDIRYRFSDEIMKLLQGMEGDDAK
jgi:site-specific DNA recombinase